MGAGHAASGGGAGLAQLAGRRFSAVASTPAAAFAAPFAAAVCGAPDTGAWSGIAGDCAVIEVDDVLVVGRGDVDVGPTEGVFDGENSVIFHGGEGAVFLVGGGR